MRDPRPDAGGAKPRDSVQAASDDMLLLGVRMRDEAALAALYDRYAPLVYTLALRMLQDRALAVNLMQDVFVRCWHDQGRYDRVQRSLAGWLLSMTRQRATEVLRAPQPTGRPGRQRVEPDLLQTEAGILEPAEAAALRATVVDAIAELSPPQREAIALAYFGGLTQTEVAERLGLSVSTVKVRIRGGIRRLRRLLGSILDGHGAGAGAAW